MSTPSRKRTNPFLNACVPMRSFNRKVTKRRRRILSEDIIEATVVYSFDNLPYSKETYEYLLSAQDRIFSKVGAGIDWESKKVGQTMRAILVDWLIEVADEYNLKLRTLELTRCYLDRFLAADYESTRDVLQLIGVACVLLASKMEEVNPPSVDQLTEITANTYTREEVMCAEKSILSVLEFDLTEVTVDDFLERFTEVVGVSEQKMKFHTIFLAELLQPHYSMFVKYKPSVLAAAIACVTKLAFKQFPKTEELLTYSRVQKKQLESCVRDVIHYYRESFNGRARQVAARDKFAQAKFMNVSSVPAPSEDPLFF